MEWREGRKGKGRDLCLAGLLLPSCECACVRVREGGWLAAYRSGVEYYTTLLCVTMNSSLAAL